MNLKIGNKTIISQTCESHENKKIKIKILDKNCRIIDEICCVPCTITTIYEEDEE